MSEDDEKDQEPDDKDKDKNKKDDEKKEAKKPNAKWPWIAAGVVVVTFIAVVLVIAFAPATSVWTDDAYVTAHFATIAPRVAGQVSGVAVEDNQLVRAGQLLVQLDDRDFRVAVANAEAMLARDEAQAQDIAAQIARLPAQIAQSESELSRAQAQLALARENARRYRNLASTGAGTVQARQESDSQLRQSQASVSGMAASLEATRRQLPILRAQYAAAISVVKSDRAQLDQARLNLSYTRILAPLDGMVGQRAVQVGDIVAPGAALMAVVPLDRLFITANYREEALRHVLPGQHVRIHVDAYNLELAGLVDSVPPASGASFAPIEPNNATGNFTKIVQRLPVKIVVAPGQNDANLLRMGLSVETTIETGLENVKADQRATPDRITAR